MPDINDDQLELIERRIADGVTERVRPALFRLYATAGMAVAAVLGYVGYNIIEDIRQNAREQAQEAIRDAIEPMLSEAETDFEASHKELLKELGKIGGLREQASSLASEVDNKLREFAPKAEMMAQLTAKIDEIDSRRKELEVGLERTNLTTTRLGAITKQVEDLAYAVAKLNDALRAGMTASGSGQTGDGATLHDEIAQTATTVVDDTTALQKAVAEAQARPTVYFQFAGSAARDQAREFARALQAEGYILPGEDREETAKNKRVVRFFYDQDQPTAEKLAADASGVLARLGYGSQQVTVESLVNYRGPKNNPGVLELWVDLTRT